MQRNRDLNQTEANALKFLLETFPYNSFVKQEHLSNEIMNTLCEKGYIVFYSMSFEYENTYSWYHSDEANIQYIKK